MYHFNNDKQKHSKFLVNGIFLFPLIINMSDLMTSGSSHIVTKLPARKDKDHSDNAKNSQLRFEQVWRWAWNRA